MASFQAKIGWKRPRKRKKKNYRSDPFLPNAEQKIQKTIVKKFKKLKTTIMHSFQGKMGQKLQRNRENKNYCSDPFLHDG